MKYFIQGGGEIHLTDQDFVAEGGEGKLYASGQEIYKIYTDSGKMIPAAKIRELSLLDKTNIIRPQAVLLDSKNKPVGFSMARVERSVALPRLFTNDFRNRNQVRDDMILRLIERMMETTVFIHDQNCLLVDGNEMNYLVDEKDYQTPYFIDVDSYQTPNFPATAIMPSIRDYHTQKFSRLTDWFAFAIVACQLFVGIHPYKGKHPKFKKRDLQARMQANLSIFNKGVSLPAAVRDFGVIPAAFHDWFVRLFEKGERVPPPLLAGATTARAIRKKIVQGTDNFIISLLREFSETIRAHTAYNGIQCVLTDSGFHIDKRVFTHAHKDTRAVFAPKSLIPLAISIRDDLLCAEEIETGIAIPAAIKAERILLANNSLYAINHDNLTQINVNEYKNKRIISAGAAWKIMPHASQVLEGMVYQSVLGKPYLAIPYPAHACMIRPIPELAGYKIIEGKHDNGVAMLTGYKDGRYDLLCIRFNKGYTEHTARIIEDIEQSEINFVTLDNGVTVHILHDGELEVFHRYSESIKLIRDPAIRTDMHLTKDGVTVLFYTGNKLYRMQMK
ncbi:MAG: hypothetical protein GY862_20055 [Gammaproteobacteria bacterium]|nr:hypothetical protein [Gammaproteobacteria bacterium]